MKNQMIKFSLVVSGILFATLLSNSARALSADSMSLNLDKMNSGVNNAGDIETRIDLMGEAKRQNPSLSNLPNFDLSRVEILMKSGLGGASAYLVVNNEYTDSASIETDPDKLIAEGGESKVTLKNLERRTKSAVILIVGLSSLKSVTLFFGPAQEVAILGSYAHGDVSMVANAGDASHDEIVLIRPPAEVLRPNGGMVNGGQGNGFDPSLPRVNPGWPTIPIPVNKPTPAGPNCAGNLCVGDTVQNWLKFKGVIRAVNPYAPDGKTVLVEFNFKTSWREPSKLTLFKRNR